MIMVVRFVDRGSAADDREGLPIFSTDPNSTRVAGPECDSFGRAEATTKGGEKQMVGPGHIDMVDGIYYEFSWSPSKQCVGYQP
jgi:hypothetical protein